MQSTEQADPSTTGSSAAAVSTQKAKTAWTKVKDIVTTARRGSTDALTPPPAGAGRSASAERCRVITADDDGESDPWIEKRPRGKQDAEQGRDDRTGRSSVSPPRSCERRLDRKRFSVSQTASTSAAKSTLSNSPLDLAGLLGKYNYSCKIF